MLEECRRGEQIQLVNDMPEHAARVGPVPDETADAWSRDC